MDEGPVSFSVSFFTSVMAVVFFVPSSLISSFDFALESSDTKYRNQDCFASPRFIIANALSILQSSLYLTTPLSFHI